MIRKIFLFALIITIGALQNVYAQTKNGYIDISEVLSKMPEAAVIDRQVNQFQKDSLNTQFNELLKTYNQLEALFTSGDTTKFTKQQLSIKRSDMEGLAYQLQNWQQISSQAVTAKQNELLEPVYKKLMQTVTEVAKANGFRSVFDKSAFIMLPPDTDNVGPLVKKRLGIKE